MALPSCHIVAPHTHSHHMHAILREALHLSRRTLLSRRFCYMRLWLDVSVVVSPQSWQSVSMDSVASGMLRRRARRPEQIAAQQAAAVARETTQAAQGERASLFAITSGSPANDQDFGLDLAGLGGQLAAVGLRAVASADALPHAHGGARLHGFVAARVHYVRALAALPDRRGVRVATEALLGLWPRTQGMVQLEVLSAMPLPEPSPEVPACPALSVSADAWFAYISAVADAPGVVILPCGGVHHSAAEVLRHWASEHIKLQEAGDTDRQEACIPVQTQGAGHAATLVMDSISLVRLQG